MTLPLSPGNGGTVTITVQGRGAAQWVALYIANGDSSWRTTTISVNGGSSVTLDQPNTGGGGVVLSIPVQLNLRSGSNTITFSAGQSSTSFFSLHGTMSIACFMFNSDDI